MKRIRRVDRTNQGEDVPVNPDVIGIGPTEELCLRVSAAALVHVTFPHPETGQAMLVLERRATLMSEQQSVLVSAKPFGGGMRINQPAALLAQIGHFHFDSPRSKDEQDFRILIRPTDWDIVKQCCLKAFHTGQSDLLETDPVRELAEEFLDTLHVTLSPIQYRLNPLELLVENEPAETGNLRAVHLPTVRIYTIFEAQLVDPTLIQHLLSNSTDISDQKLTELAEEDARKGGRGRANAVLAMPVDLLTNVYLALPAELRNDPIMVTGHHLEGNVPAVLRDVFVPKYERFSW